MKNKPVSDQTVYKVATFYQTGWNAYGGILTFDTEREASEKRDAMIRNGSKAVHIWSVTTKLIQE